MVRYISDNNIITIDVTDARLSSLVLTDLTHSQNWTISSKNPASMKLTFDVSNGSAQVFSNTGSNSISAPIVLDADLEIDVSGMELTISGIISDGAKGAKGITKMGNGTLFLGATNSYTGDTIVKEGSLIAAGLDGPGNTYVEDAHSLTTYYLFQNCLTIGKGGGVTILPIDGSPIVTALPEPCTIVLLVIWTANQIVFLYRKRVQHPTPAKMPQNARHTPAGQSP